MRLRCGKVLSPRCAQRRHRDRTKLPRRRKPTPISTRVRLPNEPRQLTAPRHPSPQPRRLARDVLAQDHGLTQCYVDTCVDPALQRDDGRERAIALFNLKRHSGVMRKSCCASWRSHAAHAGAEPGHPAAYDVGKHQRTHNVIPAEAGTQSCFGKCHGCFLSRQ